MRWTIWIISLVLLGCDYNQPPIEADLREYLSRIARVQDEDAFTAPDLSSTTLPDKRELFVEITPISMGLLDSYELRKCNLFNLIAQRNSLLGKVQDQFRNYQYQVELLDGLNRCLNNADIPASLKQQLTTIQQQKYQDLSNHFFNLLYSSDAMRKQLSGNTWLSDEMSWNTDVVRNALLTLNHMGQVTKWQAGEARNNIIDVQESLEKLPLLGQLDYSLKNATLLLQTVTNQLQRHDSKIICGQNRDTTRFRYLSNVFQNYYVERIQPYLAELDSTYGQLEPSFTMFHFATDRYVYPIEKDHQAFRRATLAHVQYWQNLFKRCGVRVGNQ